MDFLLGEASNDDRGKCEHEESGPEANNLGQQPLVASGLVSSASLCGISEVDNVDVDKGNEAKDGVESKHIPHLH